MMLNKLICNRKKLIACLVCGLASLFYVYDYFIQVAPSVMTHQLMHTLHIGAAKLGALSACFYYAYALMQMPAGILLDRFGARKLLALAIAVSALGVVLFGLSHTLFVAGMARFLIGFGSSFAFVGNLYLVSHWFSHRHFSLIAGLIQLGASLGSIFGLAPLALIVHRYGWRQSMVVAGGLTCLFALMVWLIVRDHPAGSSGFVRLPKQHACQRLLQLAKLPQLWVIALCGVMCWVSVGVVGALWGVPYLMKVYPITTVEAGKMVSLFWVALAIGSPFFGWYSNHISRRKRPFIICFAIGLIGALLLLEAARIPIVLSAIGLLFLGLSASVQSLSFGLVKDGVPAEQFATASGINNMAAILGSGLSQPMIGFLLHWKRTEVMGVPIYSLHDYWVAFLLLPASMLIGLLLSYFFLKETYCKQRIVQARPESSGI